MTASTDGGADRLDPQLIRIGLVIVSGVIMSILDTTIVNVALETLSRDLHAGLSTIQWVVTGYLLAIAIVMPITGYAVDRFGAKRMFLLSVALFTAGSVLCALAWDVHSLIVFRVLQGFGGGLLMPVGQTILARSAGPERMGRVMSIVGVPMLLGPILGPVIGGLIVDNLAWQWIFLVNLPVGLLSFVVSARVLPADETVAATRLDAGGLALMSPGLALVIYGLSRAGDKGTFGAPVVWIAMVAGALLLVAFVVRARGLGERALIPVTYFRDRAFTAASVVTVTISLAIFGALLLMPLYYQQVRDASALQAGLLLAPQGLGAAFAMPLAGTVADRLGPRYVVLAGIVTFSVATLPFTQVTDTTSYWLLGGALFVRGFGVGSTMMPAIAAGYRNLPPSAAGHASTALNIFRQIGASVGSALMAVILAHEITAATSGRRAVDPGVVAGAFGSTFWWAVGICAAAIPFALLLPDRGARARPAPPGPPVEAAPTPVASGAGIRDSA
jgi:EmrB/QacA subfamily drug resistance transporter